MFISGNSTRDRDNASNYIGIQREVPCELAEMWEWMRPGEAAEHAAADGSVGR